MQHVLHHVICIRVHNERERVAGDCLRQPLKLLRRRLVDTLLHDAAAVLVAGNLHALFVHGFVDELVVVFGPGFEYLLHDVIAVDVVAEFDEALLEKLAEQLKLHGSLDCLDQLLYRPRAVAVSADVEGVVLEALYHDGQLVLRAVFDELLNQIVAKAVDHEVERLDYGEIENLIQYFSIASFIILGSHHDLLL